jgi:hypothetical protein
MAQLYCYVPEKTAELFRKKAKQAHFSTSKYLAMLVKNEIAAEEWPENYFDLFGSWEGDPLERPNQGDLENRMDLD